MVSPAPDDATVIERVTPTGAAAGVRRRSRGRGNGTHVAETPANAWRTTLKRRLVVAAAVFLRGRRRIEARLVYLQVVPHADLPSRAERQQLRTVAAPAKRGDILDRRGHVLAYSVDADSIYAVPTEIGDRRRPPARPVRARSTTARRRIDRRWPIASARGRAFVYVRPPGDARSGAARVADLQLEGVGFMKENRRFYPNKELAAHLLGYVGIDNTGLAGIEATYDNADQGTRRARC